MRSSYWIARIVHGTKQPCVPMRTKSIRSTMQSIDFVPHPGPSLQPKIIHAVQFSWAQFPPSPGSLYSVTGQHSLQLFKTTGAVYKKIEEPPHAYLLSFSFDRPYGPNNKIYKTFCFRNLNLYLPLPFSIKQPPSIITKTPLKKQTCVTSTPSLASGMPFNDLWRARLAEL